MFISVLAGALLYMVYGGIYYSILLSDKQAAKNKEVADNEVNGPIKYVVAVIVAFISSFIVGILVQATGSDTLLEGLTLGFMVGVIISIVYLKNSLFGLLTNRTLMIAIGDHLVTFTLLGGLHGLLY